MKLLFDQNLSIKLCRQVADLFPGSSQVRQLGLAQADDRAIWQYAKANGFTLVSLDADFAELATLTGPPPKLIWLRRGNQPTAAIEILLRGHAELIAAFERDESAACLELY
jgi:predicted nuclease of predicted toxin-antitoxin system